ncbi:MAG: hypothetical protein ACRD3V_21890, partial [Vicinamibacteria bacterium]
YHLFAEIFVRGGGRVTDAFLVFPGGESQPFEDRGFVLELHGGRFQHQRDLDRAYANGDYFLRFQTPAGSVDGRLLRLRDSQIPDPPHIVLKQGGKVVAPSSVDPGTDLTVTWKEFESARADPNGILDDLIFVVLANCRGEKTVHSGRPFEGTPFLTYRTKDYTIPKEKLAAGEPHQMFVEHARVDTSKEDGMIGLVTYASTTFLDFRASGEPTGDLCPSKMPKMDEGQTDREAVQDASCVPAFLEVPSTSAYELLDDAVNHPRLLDEPSRDQPYDDDRYYRHDQSHGPESMSHQDVGGQTGQNALGPRARVHVPLFVFWVQSSGYHSFKEAGNAKPWGNPIGALRGSGARAITRRKFEARSRSGQRSRGSSGGLRAAR